MADPSLRKRTKKVLLSDDLLALVKSGDITKIQAERLQREQDTMHQTLPKTLPEVNVPSDGDGTNCETTNKRKRSGSRLLVEEEPARRFRMPFMPPETRSKIQVMWERQIREINILDVRLHSTSARVRYMREHGEPFVLVGHRKFTDFAKSWFNRQSSVDSSVPPGLRSLLVPIIKKGESSATSFHPINDKLTFGRFMDQYWKTGDPSCYLHQWQFPVESSKARKLMGAKSHANKQRNLKKRENCAKEAGEILPRGELCNCTGDSNCRSALKDYLPNCMNYDMLEDWRSNLDGENPFQYLFAGCKTTYSTMHVDPGGLGIFIAPIVGKKEVTLVHRDDGRFLYQMAPWESGNPIDFDKYPMVHCARVWRHVLCPGDVAYLPAGTYHMCRNVEPCMSYHRFHLDEINLPVFFASMYRGDAPEIEHEDIIWNTSQTIMHSCALLDPNRNEFEKYQRMLLSLRQIALTIAKNRKEQEWVDLIDDIDLSLCSSKLDSQRVSYFTDRCVRTKDLLETSTATKGTWKNLCEDATNLDTYKECQITSQEVIEGLCEQNPSAFSNLPSAVQNRYPVNAEVSIYRYGKRRTGVIVGVRENIVAWKCRYIGWKSDMDEFVPLESIENINGGGLKKNDLVKCSWGGDGEMYEAKLLLKVEDTMIFVHCPDLGAQWNTWVPKSFVHVVGSSGGIEKH